MPRPRKQQPASRSLGPFKPKERLIYSYWDGQRQRQGDPLALVRSLTSVDGVSLDIDAKLAAGSTPDAPKAMGRLIDAVRTVFGVKPLDDGGLTEAETLALLYHFLEFIQEVQADALPLPKSPGRTDSPADGSATDASSASGSTATAS